MNDPKERIKNSLRMMMMHEMNERPHIAAQVKSVSGCTCEVQPLDGALLKNVRLNACADAGKGIVITPAVGSFVMVAMLSNTDSFVAMFSKIDKVSYKDEKGCEITIEEGKIIINGGENEGLVKIRKLEDNLNALKDYCEALKTATSTGIDAVGAGNAASGATGSSAFEAAMAGQTITFVDMENEKIKQ